MKKCKRCKGTGRVELRGVGGRDSRTCPKCRGTGKAGTKKKEKNANSDDKTDN